jgi:hypothetical protein
MSTEKARLAVGGPLKLCAAYPFLAPVTLADLT